MRSKKVTKEKINVRQKKFVELIVTKNCTQSEAYEKVFGKSELSRQKAYALLQKETIKEEIALRKKELKERFNFEAEWVLNQYVEIINKAKELNNLAEWNKAVMNISKMLGLDGVTKLDINTKGIVLNYVIPTSDSEKTIEVKNGD